MNKLSVPGMSQALTSTSIVMDYLSNEKKKHLVALSYTVYNIFAKVMVWSQDIDYSVLFLDVDGVLFHDNCNGSTQKKAEELFPDVNVKFHTSHQLAIAASHFFSDRATNCLKTIICNVPNPIVVLSSTWRKNKTIFQTHVEFENHFFSSFTADRTPDTECDLHFRKLYERIDRTTEISYFLAEHPTIKRYVILDDQDEGLAEHFGDHFIHVGKTEDSSLLTEENATDAISKLSSQQPKSDLNPKKRKLEESSL